MTLQNNSTATNLKTIDKDEVAGPLIIAYNAAGTSVAATIDAAIEGIKA